MGLLFFPRRLGFGIFDDVLIAAALLFIATVEWIGDLRHGLEDF